MVAENKKRTQNAQKTQKFIFSNTNITNDE